MKKKQKCESCAVETPIVIDGVDRDPVPQVTEEALAEDLTEIETSKKLKEKTKQCYINHI